MKRAYKDWNPLDVDANEAEAKLVYAVADDMSRIDELNVRQLKKLAVALHFRFQREREATSRRDRECEEMVNRLFRIADHLKTLSAYASREGYDDLDSPPPIHFHRHLRRLRAHVSA